MHAGGQLRDLQALRGVFVAREGRQLGQLAAAMKGVPSEGVFDTWMKRQSDLVQATALAYAEREVLEASMRTIERVCSHPFTPIHTGVCHDTYCITWKGTCSLGP